MEAQDYKKLVEALRLCQFGECGCGKCYYKELKGDWCTEDNHPEFFDCDDKLKLDAADALEAAEQRIDGLQKLVDINTERCEALRKQLREAQEQYEKHLNELEKELSFSESTYEEFQITAAKQNALLAKQLPVRCKDCKWYKAGYDIDGKWFSRCNGSVRTYGHTKPDWFCADGEREVQE